MVIQLLHLKQDVVIEQFSTECCKTKTKVLWPITKDAEQSIVQSRLEVIFFKFSKPITKHSKRNIKVNANYFPHSSENCSNNYSIQRYNTIGKVCQSSTNRNNSVNHRNFSLLGTIRVTLQEVNWQNSRKNCVLSPQKPNYSFHVYSDICNATGSLDIYWVQLVLSSHKCWNCKFGSMEYQAFLDSKSVISHYQISRKKLLKNSTIVGEKLVRCSATPSI